MVADPAEPRAGGFFRSEKAQRAPFHLFIGSGVPDFLIRAEGHAILSESKRGEVVGDEFHGLRAPEDRHGTG